jgi:hypothetical protein
MVSACSAQKDESDDVAETEQAWAVALKAAGRPCGHRPSAQNFCRKRIDA